VALAGGTLEALIDGPIDFTFGSSLTVDQTGRLAQTAEFHSLAMVSVPDPDDLLVLSGETRYGTAVITGAGTIRQDGDVIVDSDAVLGPITTYDWDGNTQSTTNVLSGATFTINANTIEPGPLFDGFDGVLNLPGGTVVVNTNTPWGFCGDALLNLLGGDGATIAGNTMEHRGFMNVDGTGHLQARINVYEQGEIHTFDADALIEMSSPQTSRLLGGLISGAGTLRVVAGATLHGFGLVETAVDCDGTLRAEDGTLTLSGPVTSIAVSGVIGTENEFSELFVTNLWNTGITGHLSLKGGLVSGGDVFNTSTTTGFGVLNVGAFTNRGLLAPGTGLLFPGSKSGLLTLGGNFFHLEDGLFDVGIGGYVPGVEHDQVIVGGDVTLLGGAFDIGLINNFVPTLGDIFIIMVYSSQVGQFDTVTGTKISGGREFAVEYHPTQLILRVVLNDCPADFDDSGGVGISDFLALLAAWGPCFGCPEDLDGDNVVGITDFLALLANWGPCP
jgi:hypothetical protein